MGRTSPDHLREVYEEEAKPPFAGVAHELIADPQPASERSWGKWRARANAYFVQCAEKAADLSQQQLWEILGWEGEARLGSVHSSQAALNARPLPNALRVGEFGVSGATNGCLRVAGYSKFDPLDLSNSLLFVLPYFDGNADTASVVERIRSEQGIELDTALLRRLIDHGILEPVKDADTTSDEPTVNSLSVDEPDLDSPA